MAIKEFTYLDKDYAQKVDKESKEPKDQIAENFTSADANSLKDKLNEVIREINGFVTIYVQQSDMGIYVTDSELKNDYLTNYVENTTFNDLDSTVIDLGSSLNSLSQDLASLTLEKDTIVSNVDVIDSKLKDVIVDVDVINDEITTINQTTTEINTVLGDTTTLLTETSEVAGQTVTKVSTMAEVVTNISSDVSTNTNQISTIDSEVSDVQTDIANINNDISTINKTTTEIGNVLGDTSQLSGDITSVVLDVQTDVSNNVTAISSVGDRVTASETDIQNINNDISTINNTIVNLGDISGLVDDTGQPITVETAITSGINSITILDSQLNDVVLDIDNINNDIQQIQNTYITASDATGIFVSQSTYQDDIYGTTGLSTQITAIGNTVNNISNFFLDETGDVIVLQGDLTVENLVQVTEQVDTLQVTVDQTVIDVGGIQQDVKDIKSDTSDLHTQTSQIQGDLYDLEKVVGDPSQISDWPIDIVTQQPLSLAEKIEQTLDDVASAFRTEQDQQTTYETTSLYFDTDSGSLKLLEDVADSKTVDDKLKPYLMSEDFVDALDDNVKITYKESHHGRYYDVEIGTETKLEDMVDLKWTMGYIQDQGFAYATQIPTKDEIRELAQDVFDDFEKYELSVDEIKGIIKDTVLVETHAEAGGLSFDLKVDDTIVASEILDQDAVQQTAKDKIKEEVRIDKHSVSGGYTYDIKVGGVTLASDLVDTSASERYVQDQGYVEDVHSTHYSDETYTITVDGTTIAPYLTTRTYVGNQVADYINNYVLSSGFKGDIVNIIEDSDAIFNVWLEEGSDANITFNQNVQTYLEDNLISDVEFITDYYSKTLSYIGRTATLKTLDGMWFTDLDTGKLTLMTDSSSAATKDEAIVSTRGSFYEMFRDLELMTIYNNDAYLGQMYYYVKYGYERIHEKKYVYKSGVYQSDYSTSVTSTISHLIDKGIVCYCYAYIGKSEFLYYKGVIHPVMTSGRSGSCYSFISPEINADRQDIGDGATGTAYQVFVTCYGGDPGNWDVEVVQAENGNIYQGKTFSSASLDIHYYEPD